MSFIKKTIFGTFRDPWTELLRVSHFLKLLLKKPPLFCTTGSKVRDWTLQPLSWWSWRSWLVQVLSLQPGRRNSNNSKSGWVSQHWAVWILNHIFHLCHSSKKLLLFIPAEPLLHLVVIDQLPGSPPSPLLDVKHRKNCKCCPGHSLIVNH